MAVGYAIISMLGAAVAGLLVAPWSLLGVFFAAPLGGSLSVAGAASLVAVRTRHTRHHEIPQGIIWC